MEKGLTKQQIISQLAKSPHGKLEEYLEVGLPAAKQDIEFFSRLAGWTFENGQVRDAKVALPVILLSTRPDPDPYGDHGAALLAGLDHRNFLRAVEFSRSIPQLKPAFKTIK